MMIHMPYEQWPTGQRDESQWAETDVGRSDDVGQLDKSLAFDNLLAVTKWAGRIRH